MLETYFLCKNELKRKISERYKNKTILAFCKTYKVSRSGIYKWLSSNKNDIGAKTFIALCHYYEVEYFDSTNNHIKTILNNLKNTNDERTIIVLPSRVRT